MYKNAFKIHLSKSIKNLDENSASLFFSFEEESRNFAQAKKVAKVKCF